MTKRILAMTLCLALTLLACACAASNASVSAPESTDNKDESSTDLSTMEQPDASTPASQMSSQAAPSDEESKPTEPILPEEKETTLEKVLSFEIGMEGLFEYGFLYYDDPSEAEVRIPGFLFADGNGNFYHTDDVWIVRLNDGAKFPYSNQFQCIDISTHGNLFYVLTGDGIARKYDISAGFEKAVLVKEYPLFEANVGSGELYHTGDVEPLFRDRDGTFFTLKKEALPEEKVPFVYDNTQKTDLEVNEEGRFSIAENTDERIYVPFFGAQGIVLTKQSSPDIQETYVQSTNIYTEYSSRGELLSRFVYLVQYSTAKHPCNIQYQSGNTVYTLEKTYTLDLFVNSYSFEDALGSNIIFGDDGCSYLAVYYSDYGEVYRIKPGYTDETFVPTGADTK